MSFCTLPSATMCRNWSVVSIPWRTCLGCCSNSTTESEIWGLQIWHWKRYASPASVHSSCNVLSSLSRTDLPCMNLLHFPQFSQYSTWTWFLMLTRFAMMSMVSTCIPSQQLKLLLLGPQSRWREPVQVLFHPLLNSSFPDAFHY